jgi:cytoskeleton protein RodZ
MTPELTQAQQGIDTTPSADGGDARSPGVMIRRARERARLSTEELAAQIKLSRSTLEALERDDFKVLVEPVYVRGYYRKCAKLLSISEKELVDAYQARVAPRAPEAPSKLRLASGTELGSGNRLPVWLATLAAIAAVIICAFIWFARGESSRVPPAVAAKVEAMTPEEDKTDADADADAAPAATTAEPATAAPASAAATTAAIPPQLAAAPAASQAPAAVPPAVASAATTPAPVKVAPAPAPAAAASGSIALRFTVTSWARVDDAAGKTLLNGLVRAGEKQTLSGAAPFAVFLGNATGVNVDINGKPVDLPKYTAQNNTARFTLGAGTP